MKTFLVLSKMPVTVTNQRILLSTQEPSPDTELQDSRSMLHTLSVTFLTVRLNVTSIVPVVSRKLFSNILMAVHFEQPQLKLVLIISHCLNTTLV